MTNSKVTYSGIQNLNLGFKIYIKPRNKIKVLNIFIQGKKKKFRFCNVWVISW